MARRALGPDALTVARAVDRALPSAGRVVLGVSGGADSMALAAGAAWALTGRGRRHEPAPQVVAAIVDHGLQPGSAETARTVAGRVDALGLKTMIISVHVPADDADGPEAAARSARYAALRDAATGGSARTGMIMVGHTLDDQAETVLLGLARGSGTRSLAGMAPVLAGPVPVVRPLLDLPRATTRAACDQWGLQVWADPHNLDPSYARVRVRGRVLPVLEAELGPGVAQALARTAALTRQDADALDEWAARALPTVECQAGLSVAALAELPRAVATRVLRSWLRTGGVGQTDSAHVEAVWQLVEQWHGQGPVMLPGGLAVRRRDGKLELQADGAGTVAQPPG